MKTPPPYKALSFCYAHMVPKRREQIEWNVSRTFLAADEFGLVVGKQ